MPLTDDWFDSPILHRDATAVRSLDPNFSEHIPPLVARRLCTLLRRAVVLSRLTLREANLEHPDAIISGTGLGCIQNTERFLHAIRQEGEECLQPTAFMQSTHNIISATIAIDLKCHAYNTTYSTPSFGSVRATSATRSSAVSTNSPTTISTSSVAPAAGNSPPTVSPAKPPSASSSTANKTPTPSAASTTSASSIALRPTPSATPSTISSPPTAAH